MSWLPNTISWQPVHGGEAVQRGFAGQIVWLAVWFAAYRVAWNRGLRRYGAVGG